MSCKLFIKSGALTECNGPMEPLLKEANWREAGQAGSRGLGQVGCGVETWSESKSAWDHRDQ